MKKKRAKKSRFYFDEKVENAIVRYNKEEDNIIKNKIYNEEIKYAIEKLAENIINTFKFPYIQEKFSNKKADVVSHIMLNLDKYDINKGKAYSYFGQAAKNYLIISNNNSYKKLKTDFSISESEEDEQSDKDVFEIEDYHITSKNAQTDKQDFIKLLVKYLDKNLNKIFRKTREIHIANAIVQLLQNYDIFIENFNKKSLYILIKEMTGCKAIYITRVLNKIKNIYVILREEYNQNGHISLEYKQTSKKKSM